MSFSPLALAERIIRAAGREHPADAVLRQELKAQRRLPPEEAARVSAAVFAYYRWRGWLNAQQPLSEQMKRALDLTERFAQRPESFSDSDLLSRAVPEWIQQEVQTSAGWVRALQAEPALWLRARPGQGGGLCRKLGNCSQFGAGPLGDGLHYAGRADLFLTKEFHTGQFELQDITSQAVGLVCAPEPGQRWWDACAGEGGKLLHLSDLMGNKGLIWASDRAGWRLQRLKRRAARARVFNYRAAEWNGGPGLPTKTKFDGVLVDAPCSGTGTWQRNPQARWTTEMRDVQELGVLQQQLLRNVAQAVKPGGKLVYAVCTLTRTETVDVAEAFERECAEFQRVEIGNPLAPESLPERRLFLWPQRFGGNGMFIVVWRRQ